ncbi:MAG TPA: phage tail sheath subtilisin-like domain-containing protein [Terriglobia bacterium]|nr:phage tail sheath subtilisin-like domain-containing protein [Terriglobia bacterium]
MARYLTPGVYKEEVLPVTNLELLTGVPAFLGIANPQPPVKDPQLLTSWDQKLFQQKFGDPIPGSHLFYAVRGFFENGGLQCYVVPLQDGSVSSLEAGLALLEPLETIDLICAPDILALRSDPQQSGRWVLADPVQVSEKQRQVMEHCARQGDRFAILDALPGADLETVATQRRALGRTIASSYAALYYPWIRPIGSAIEGSQDGTQKGSGFVPPCGHIAGVYARTDQQFGVFKAPANEVLKGVIELEVNLNNDQQGDLNPQGINALRVFPGRGIRVWGARTISPEPWRYVNVRRLFITLHRWIDLNLADVVFEPNDQRLWAQITRELTDYLTDWYRKGALQGASPETAFYVKCDAETNPPAKRDIGQVTTEIGLAAAVPGEFIVIRIIQSPDSTTLSTAVS